MLLMSLFGVTKKLASRGARSGDRPGRAGSEPDARATGTTTSKPTPKHDPKPHPRPVYRVVHVMDADTFEVRPYWVWNGQTSGKVGIANYVTQHPHGSDRQQARDELTRLILGKKVELGAVTGIDRGRLVCEVYMNGTDLPSLLKVH